MPKVSDILRTLLRSTRWILVRGVFAAVLALLVSLALPQSFEAELSILPPLQRTDDFRYQAHRWAGLKRMLESLRLKDRIHPVEVYFQIVESRQFARTLDEELGLSEKWSCESSRELERELRRRFEAQATPFGPVVFRARTEDPELSAQLVNTAARLLEDRLHELYVADLENENTTIRASLKGHGVDMESLEAARTQRRILEGIVEPESQDQAESSALDDLVREATTARAIASLRARELGPEAPETRDAEQRAQGLAEAVHKAKRSAPATHEFAEQASEDGADRTRRFLFTLQQQIEAGRAGQSVGVRVLDTALPPERPDRSRLAWAVTLAFLIVPMTVAARTVREPIRQSLARESRDELGKRIVDATMKWVDAITLWRWSERSRSVVTPLVAATLGLVAVQWPLLAMIPLSVLFVAILAASRRAGWLALIIALPWAYNYVNREYGFYLQFPTEPGVILLMFAWGFAILAEGRRVPKNALLPPIVAMLAWMALTIPMSFIPVVSLRHFLTSALFVVAGAVFPILEVRSVGFIERVLKVYIWSAVGLAIYGIIEVTTSPLPLDRAAFFIGKRFLSNHGPYAAYLCYALGPALVFLLVDEKRRRSFAWVAATTVILFAVAISLTRASWVSLAALLFVLAVSRASQSVKSFGIPILVGFVAALVGFAASPGARNTAEEYLARAVSMRYGSNLERLNRWQASFQMFIDRPLTGVGGNAYEWAYPNYRQLEFANPLSDDKMGAHSELLRVAAEQGIPGLAILAWLVFTFYSRALFLMRSGKSQRIRMLAGGLAAGVFTYSIHSFFNEYWREPKMILTLFVYVGLLGALDEINRRRDDSGESDEGRLETA